MFSQLYYSVKAGMVKRETYPWERGLEIEINILFIIMNKYDKVNLKVFNLNVFKVNKPKAHTQRNDLFIYFYLLNCFWRYRTFLLG